MFKRIWKTKTFRASVLTLVGLAIAVVQGELPWTQAITPFVMAVLAITGRDAVAKVN